eukprot:TRINITY_DN27644_c0_g1_i1.p1 TRINITY_DN27644_c0_g1~~TRINITY_DN27644_c0_g1_i1.p1  ORF type:complete len:742 (-),score=263.21 TRINITY_DN27644_c0_g1_i1:406-2631(-)
MEPTAPETSPRLLRQLRREIFDICTDSSHAHFAEVQTELQAGGVSAWHLIRLPSVAALCGPRFPYSVLFSALRDGTIADFDQSTHTVRLTPLEARLSSFVQSSFEDEPFAAHAGLQALFANRRPEEFWPSELLFTLADVQELLPRAFTVDDDVFATVARAFSTSEIVAVSDDGRLLRRRSDTERLKLHTESYFSAESVAKDKWVQDTLRRAANDKGGYIKLSDVATWGRVRRLSSFLKPWEIRKNREWKDSELRAVLEESDVVELHPDGRSIRWRGSVVSPVSTPPPPRLNWSASSLPPPPVLTPVDAIVRDVERAFGDANYVFDRRLQSLEASDSVGYVKISEAAQLGSLDDAGQAEVVEKLRTSTVVEVGPELSVRRRSPLPAHIVRPFLGVESSDLTVMSYNVLADKMATLKDQYVYCSQEYLYWDNRRVQLEREIVFYHADIICLQEVQSTRLGGDDPKNHAHWFATTFARHRYGSVFRQRIRKQQDPDFGNMILWDKTKLDKVAHVDFEFRQVLLKRCLELAQQPKQEPEARRQLATITKLIDAEPFCQNAQIVHLRLLSSGRDVFVANAHLHIGKDDEKFLQVLQVQTLVQQLAEFISKEAAEGRCHASLTPATIFCGDLNATPKSEAYELLSAGRLASGTPTTPASMRLPYDSFGHNFEFGCTYRALAGVELVTNWTPPFVDTLDYVWFSRRGLRPSGVLGVPDLSALNALPGIPDAVRPSDHFSLLCHFSFES